MGHEFIAHELVAIDYFIIATYMVGVLMIGTFYAKYVKTGGDFFIAGKSLPFWAIGMSIVVSDIGAIDFISGAGASYKYGLAQANFDWIGSMPALAIAAFIFIPYYWRAGVYTIPEFLGRRYNVGVQLITAISWALFLVWNLSIMLWVTAVMLSEVLGMDRYLAIWGTAAIVGIYTVSGGLAAVVMTDVIQMVIMFIGAGALLTLSYWEIGGWDSLKEKVYALGPEFSEFFTLYQPHETSGPYPWTGIVFGLGIVMSTGYFVGNQAVVQRALGARSEWDAKAGVLFAGLLKFFIPILVLLPGLAALGFFPGLDDADVALPRLIKELLPPGLTGLMFAAFFAALMSSVDSYLNSSSTIIIQDIYVNIRKLFRIPEMTTGHALKIGRILTVVLIVSGALFAPVIERFETIYVALQTFMSLFQGPTLAILLLGILWSRTNRWGALAGLLLGIPLCWIMNLVDGLFPSEDPFLFVAWWSFLFTLVVVVIVSLLTKAEPPEKIRGLVYGSVVGDSEAQNALEGRMNA